MNSRKPLESLFDGRLAIGVFVGAFCCFTLLPLLTGLTVAHFFDRYQGFFSAALGVGVSSFVALYVLQLQLEKTRAANIESSAHTISLSLIAPVNILKKIRDSTLFKSKFQPTNALDIHPILWIRHAPTQVPRPVHDTRSVSALYGSISLESTSRLLVINVVIDQINDRLRELLVIQQDLVNQFSDSYFSTGLTVATFKHDEIEALNESASKANPQVAHLRSMLDLAISILESVQDEPILQLPETAIKIATVGTG